MEKKKLAYGHFIDWITDRLGDVPRIKDKGAVARLKRADNPSFAPQAWDILISLNVPDRDILPCLTVGAAMCRNGEPNDGSDGLGAAIASCWGDDRDQGAMRLRRLLSCTDTEELCAVLRPILSLVASKATKRLSYAVLLDDAVSFGNPYRQKRIKLRWAREYWSVPEEKETTDGKGKETTDGKGKETTDGKEKAK